MSDAEGESLDARFLPQVERPKKLAETVAAHLLNFITANNLAPGAPLPPQQWLVENLGVGRVSLREALRFLEMLGFVELRAGRNGGPIVGDVSSKNFARMSIMYFHAIGVTVRQVMDARCVLEPAMVRSITDRGLRPAEVEVLQRFRVGKGSTKRATGWQSTHDFHSSVAELSGNGVLKLVAESTGAIYGGVARDVVLTPEELHQIERVHADIAEAMIAGDGPNAQALMAEHVAQVMATYERTYTHILSSRIPWP